MRQVREDEANQEAGTTAMITRYYNGNMYNTYPTRPRRRRRSVYTWQGTSWGAGFKRVVYGKRKRDEHTT